MATVKDIVSQYRLPSSAATRTEEVPGDAPAQISDPGKPVKPWDTSEYLGAKVPDDVLQQILDVRKMLTKPSGPFKVGVPTDKSALPSGPNAKPTFMQSVDASKNVYFIDPSWKAPELTPECKALRDAWQKAPDDKKDGARIAYMQKQAFAHLLDGREGQSNAINTYDAAVFTWGAGFAANHGQLGDVLAAIYATEAAANTDIEKHSIQKLFYLCGFKYEAGKYWAVSDKGDVYASATADVSDTQSAFRTIHDVIELHYMWALLASDPLTKKTLLDAQFKVFLKNAGKIDQPEKIQTATLFTFIAHLRHWGMGLDSNVVGWSLGNDAPVKVTATLPSEKGDAQLAVNVVHYYYRYREDSKGKENSRNPSAPGTSFETHVRKYWGEMIGKDAKDEGLTDFQPDYPAMTAPPTASVPADHLAASAAAGGSYDLGPLSDFGRAPKPAAPSTPPPASSPPPSTPSAPPPSAPDDSPPAPKGIENPSWAHCFARGTPISCPGGVRRIEELEENDAILAFDVEKRETVVAFVTRAVAHPPAACLVVSIDGTSSLRVTPNHPIFVGGVWRCAEEVRAGDEVLFLDGETKRVAARRVVAVERAMSLESVHDLSVARHENYFAANVLVHNKIYP